jgi:hypothetical protein
MSRYTSELAAKKVNGIYHLVLIASARAREIAIERSRKHATDGFPRVPFVYTNGPIITALTEVENGLVGSEYLHKGV